VADYRPHIFAKSKRDLRTRLFASVYRILRMDDMCDCLNFLAASGLPNTNKLFWIFVFCTSIHIRSKGPAWQFHCMSACHICSKLNSYENLKLELNNKTSRSSRSNLCLCYAVVIQKNIRWWKSDSVGGDRKSLGI